MRTDRHLPRPHADRCPQRQTFPATIWQRAPLHARSMLANRRWDVLLLSLQVADRWAGGTRGRSGEMAEHRDTLWTRGDIGAGELHCAGLRLALSGRTLRLIAWLAAQQG